VNWSLKPNYFYGIAEMLDPEDYLSSITRAKNRGRAEATSCDLANDLEHSSNKWKTPGPYEYVNKITSKRKRGPVVDESKDSPEELDLFLEKYSQNPGKILRKLSEIDDPLDRDRFVSGFNIHNALDTNALSIAVLVLTVAIFIPTYIGIHIAINSVQGENITIYSIPFYSFKINKDLFMGTSNLVIIIFLAMLLIRIRKNIIKWHEHLLYNPINKLKRLKVFKNINLIISNLIAILLMLFAFLVCFILPLYIFSTFLSY
jgi:hypothetical protein